IPDLKRPNVSFAEKIRNENIPSALYKYRGFDSGGYSLANFENDQMWLAAPKDFNDPFDALLKNNIDESIDNQEDWVNHKSDFTQFCIGRGLRDSEVELAYQTYKEVTESIKKNKNLLNLIHTYRLQSLFRVGCLCETNTSVLMWSHYANNHTGFCVEYDLRNAANDDTAKQNLYPVLYQERSDTQRDDACSGIEYYGLYAVLRKSMDWAYEKEWRIVLSFFSMEKPGNIQLPKATAVYLGCKINDKNTEKIKDIAKHKSIPIYKATLNSNNGLIFYSKI
ncbi:MAG: DUF2971 domain-containing protein, partial [Oscillospiraceae bacterium]|nr:DUF2971 domain-containing protein [Oscillospiraceae bacterium]